ncbi:hypothetical protein [Pseudomonas japonica]|uniref:hypothetical protein n=1 Tax=Pseudomonas japonica TaxID=256466 RepID=UPI0011326509|nr:hypothetical protein [Pseudomonas japonica]
MSIIDRPRLRSCKHLESAATKIPEPMNSVVRGFLQLSTNSIMNLAKELPRSIHYQSINGST